MTRERYYKDPHREYEWAADDARCIRESIVHHELKAIELRVELAELELYLEGLREEMDE